MEIIPHKDRQGKIILYLSFPVYLSEVNRGENPIQASVNDTTERLAPDALVK